MADIPTGGAGGLAPGGGNPAKGGAASPVPKPGDPQGSASSAGADQAGSSGAADKAKNQADAAMGDVSGDAGNKAQGGKDSADASKVGPSGSGGPKDAAGSAGEVAKEALDPLKGGPAVAMAPTLGAGGTSKAGGGDTGDAGAPDAGEAGGDKAKLGQKSAMAGAVPAAGAAAQLMVLMMFLKLLKGILMALAALLANLWNLILAAIIAAVKAVVGFVLGIGASIAGAIGGFIGGALGAVGGGLLAGAATFALVVLGGGALANSANNDSTVAQRDGKVEDCTVAADQDLDNIDEPTSVDATTKKNAQTVYSVFAAWGMPKENIAGILGNWDAESTIDPTGMEGIFDEPHTMGPKKKAADASGSSPGIGLGQWTAGRNTNLRDYAADHNTDWWSLPLQLGFMISDAESTDADIVKGMIADPEGSPGEAAVYFHDAWERSADTSMDVRKSRADKWMGLMGGWTADQELADSILEQAKTTVDSATESEADSVRSTCRDAKGSQVGMAEGGLTKEEAQKVIDLYLKEGDSFLDKRYGAGGGPGSCEGDHAMNCVSFSTYFLNKYTSFQQYPQGNGIDTASRTAAMSDRETSKTPTPYSVGSGPGSGPAGHTFVVLGVEGENLVIGEAGYCSNRGSVRVAPKSEFSAWEFVDVSDLMLPEGDVKTS